MFGCYTREFLSLFLFDADGLLPPSSLHPPVQLEQEPGSDDTSLPSACHKFLQSLFTVFSSRPHYPEGLAVISRAANVHRIRSRRSHGVVIVSSKRIADITVRREGLCGRLISPGLEGLLPERESSIPVKRLRHIHLLFLW